MSTFYLLFSGMAVLLLASWPGLVVSSRPTADDSVKAGNHEAVKKDFLNWVDKVGEAHQAHVQSGTVRIPYRDPDQILLAAAGNTITVGAGGQYSSVQAAVNAAGNSGRTTIVINSGTYEEKITVPKGKLITFQGNGNPTLVYGDTAGSAGSTANSASTAILADGFIAIGITFKNSAPAPSGGAVGKQAVALRISGDQGAFYNCNFYGAQDTLYDQAGRHYFKNCFIQGSIDFIFGDGQSLYQSCQLNSIAQPGQGSLTAQKRTGNENTGFSFVGCTITGTGPIYLGRAWGPNSRVVFIQCNIADIILPSGWYDWGVSSRENTVFYGQYECSGPGANTSGRVGWSMELTAAQAVPFETVSFIDGSSWLQT